MSGAWVGDPADFTYVGTDLVASPHADTLPLPDSKEERDAITEREQQRKTRGIGFAPPQPS